MAGLSSIFDMASEGLMKGLRGLPMTFCLYLMPFLAGSAVIILLEIVWQSQLGLGFAPYWLRDLGWAPFAAIIYVSWLRWWLFGEVSRPLLGITLYPETAIGAAIVFVWFWLTALLDDAPSFLLGQLVDLSNARLDEMDAIIDYSRMLTAAGFLLRVIMNAVIFGLLFITVLLGKPSLRALLALLRQHPFALLTAALIGSAAEGGVTVLYYQTLISYSLLFPFPEMIVWRPNVVPAFLAELAIFPLHFLRFVVYTSIMATVYEWLSAQAARSEPGEAPA